MTKRKLILLAACGILLAVCIVQAITLNKNTVKVFAYSAEPDCVKIEKSGSEVVLTKNGDGWVTGAKNYAANQASVDALLNGLKSIKALDKVGSSASEAGQEKYELTDSKKITVTAYSGSKVLRKLAIGKNSATGSQSYAAFDDSSDVYLVSGNLRSTFDKSAADLRSNQIWELNKDMIGSIEVSKADGTEFTVSREGVAENMKWNLDGHGIVTGEVDGTKAESWFGEFATLSCSAWAENESEPEGKYLLSCKITCGEKIAAIELYETKAEEENSPAEYAAKSSESPYVFELSSYSARKFLKDSSELLK